MKDTIKYSIRESRSMWQEFSNLKQLRNFSKAIKTSL